MLSLERQAADKPVDLHDGLGEVTMTDKRNQSPICGRVLDAQPSSCNRPFHYECWPQFAEVLQVTLS